MLQFDFSDEVKKVLGVNRGGLVQIETSVKNWDASTILSMCERISSLQTPPWLEGRNRAPKWDVASVKLARWHNSQHFMQKDSEFLIRLKSC